MKKKRDNFVAHGSIKIRWRKFADGRTAIDPRRYGRQRQTFVDHTEALREARRLCLEIYGGGTEAAAFTAEDRAAYAHALTQVRRHSCELVPAIQEWSAARQVIAGQHTIAEVIAAGLQALHRPVHLIPDIAAEMLASQSPKDLHGRGTRDLLSTLQLLSRKFPGDIRMPKAGDLEILLDGEKQPDGTIIGGLRKRGGGLVGSRRRDNVLDYIRSFFKFARDRGYLPDVVTEAKKVPRIHTDALNSSISYFSVVETRLIMAHVSEEWLPYAVLRLFSGGRSEELALGKDAKKSKDPLRWDDFDWDEREIVVRPETSKVGRARRMPIVDNAFQWLIPYRNCTGYIAPKGKRPDREFGRGGRLEQHLNGILQRTAMLKNDLPVQLHLDVIAPAQLPLLTEFSYRQNAMRHSYGSYRAAVLKNVHQLAEEMGDSPAMIRRHYDNPRPKSQAKAYFAILPKKAADIISIETHAA